ncbi:MAG TPA: AAA family ATPase [Pirellulales bacterium]
MRYDTHDDIEADDTVIPSGVLKLDEIQADANTAWLWADTIPVGHVTIVTGEACAGKSLLAAEIAARATTGDGPRPAGAVLIAHSNAQENSLLKGRLLAAGADPAHVAVVNCDVFAGGKEPATTEERLVVLEGALVQSRGASLLVIDHLAGWLGKARLRPDEAHEVFQRLAEMAARYGVAVAVLWRLEKGGRAAQTRALDALATAAPVVWLLTNDPYRRQGRLAVCVQNRLGPPPENMAFGLDGNRLARRDAIGRTSVDDACGARTADHSERRQAARWLLELLARGAIEAQQLWAEARQCGLAERTVRRAAAELDLHPVKDGIRNVWLWGVDLTGGPSAAAAAPAMPADPAAQNLAALPLAGSLTDATVVRVELRPELPPSESRSVVSGAAVAAIDQQNLAALPPADSLTGTAADAPRPERSPAVEAEAGASENDVEGLRIPAALSGKSRRHRRRREHRFNARPS